MKADQIKALRSKVQKAAAFFRPLIDLEAELDSLVALDSTRANIEKAIDVGRVDLEKIKGEVAHWQRQNEDAKATFRANQEQAGAEARELLANARADADGKLAFASSLVERMIAESEALDDEIEGKKAELAGVQAGISEAQDTLAALHKEIEDLKARFS